MHEEFKKLGQLLKSKREGVSLSLKEIENSTSIRCTYLEAIETGKIEESLSSVYVVGFIRQYINFLGLDLEKITLDFPEVFKRPHQKYDFAYGIGTMEMRGSAGGGVKWLPNLLWASLSAVILVLAWFLAKYLGVI